MRLRILISAFLVAFGISIFGAAVNAISASFTDVPLANPAFEHIEYLKRNLIFQGLPDGTFGISKTAKRGEFLKVLLISLHDRLIFLNTESPIPLFSDIKFSKGAWYAPYVVTAKIDRIMQGDKDGKIQLTKEVSRAEAIASVVRALDYRLSDFKTVEVPFNDVKTASWFKPYVRVAFQQNLFPVKGKNFNPSKAVSREEMAELIYRAIVQKQKKERLAIHSRLVVEEGAAETEPTEPVLPEPYKEKERAQDLISSLPSAKPDLTISKVEKTTSEDGIYQGALKITVENQGNAAVSDSANFCVYSRPDWYNYKPGYNSTFCAAGIANPVPPLYPGKQFVFYVWGECDQTYKKTSETFFAVDPNYISGEDLVSAAGAASVEEFIAGLAGFDSVRESDEKNNDFNYKCEP